MFDPETFYHIYNRANGNENLFREERNYHFFLDKYFHYINEFAETFAYCLMPNHFHFMIRTKAEEGLQSSLIQSKSQPDILSHQFSNLFNSYSKSFNSIYNRNGSLFQRPFKYKKVSNEAYLCQLILYIHNNPAKHGFVKNLIDWPYSSIHLFITRDTLPHCGILEKSRKEVIEWFGGNYQFELAHLSVGKISSIYD